MIPDPVSQNAQGLEAQIEVGRNHRTRQLAHGGVNRFVIGGHPPNCPDRPGFLSAAEPARLDQFDERASDLITPAHELVLCVDPPHG